MKILALIAKTACVFLFAVISVFAQNVNQNRQKLAETFETNGDYRNASRIYEELWKANPANDSYFFAYSRNLYALNQFAELLPQVENYIQRVQTNEAYCLYAEVLWKLGKTKEANSAWEKSLESNAKDAKTYINTANSQGKLFLFDKAVNTFETARKILNNTQLFADELSRLYVAVGNAKKAAEELMVYFAQTKNIPQTQGRIQALLQDKESKEYVRNSLKKESDSGNLNYSVLYAWFLSAIEEFDKSLEVYAFLDKKLDTKGLEIYNFANARVKDNQYEIAMKAFGLIIDQGKSSPYLINALFGYTRAMETKAEMMEQFTEKDCKQMIERYNNIVDAYPGNSFAFDAQYRIAVIYLERLKQEDKAITSLLNLKDAAKNQVISYRAINTLADIYFKQNDLQKSKEMFQLSSSTNNNAFANEKDYADFRLAEFVYYDGGIDSSLAMFKLIAENPASNYANDALEKIFLLDQNKNQNKAIRLFAQAEKLNMQDKDLESIPIYKDAIEAGSGELAELAYLSISDIYKKLNKYSEQRSILIEFLSKNPESIYCDRVIFDIAESFFAEKQLQDALKYFTDLLAKFPKSIYSEEARNKIRLIRSSVSS